MPQDSNIPHTISFTTHLTLLHLRFTDQTMLFNIFEFLYVFVVFWYETKTSRRKSDSLVMVTAVTQRGTFITECAFTESILYGYTNCTFFPTALCKQIQIGWGWGVGKRSHNFPLTPPITLLLNLFFMTSTLTS